MRLPEAAWGGGAGGRVDRALCPISGAGSGPAGPLPITESGVRVVASLGSWGVCEMTSQPILSRGEVVACHVGAGEGQGLWGRECQSLPSPASPVGLAFSNENPNPGPGSRGLRRVSGVSRSPGPIHVEATALQTP